MRKKWHKGRIKKEILIAPSKNRDVPSFRRRIIQTHDEEEQVENIIKVRIKSEI